MDEKNLKIFLVAARHRSLRAAAKVLYLSEPSVGIRIRRLEEELGVQLLDRGERGIRLTQAGEVIAELAPQILTLCEDLRRAVPAFPHDPPGVFAIATTTSLANYRIVPILSQISTARDPLRLSVITCSPAEIVRGVLSRRFHVGLLSSLSHSGLLEVLPLAGDALQLIASAQTVVAPTPLSAGDLRQWPLICPGPPNRAWSVIERFLRQHQAMPHHLVHINNGETIKHAVVKSPGALGFVPSSVLHGLHRDHTISSKLQIVPIEHAETLRIPYYLIWRPGNLRLWQRDLIHRLQALLSPASADAVL